MSELVRSVGLLSGQQLVLMVLGATRTKIVATLLGPAGTGLLAQTVTLPNVPLEWQVAGVGDLDRDGMADLVWRNTANSQTAAFLVLHSSLHAL